MFTVHFSFLCFKSNRYVVGLHNIPIGTYNKTEHAVHSYAAENGQNTTTTPMQLQL